MRQTPISHFGIFSCLLWVHLFMPPPCHNVREAQSLVLWRQLLKGTAWWTYWSLDIFWSLLPKKGIRFWMPKYHYWEILEKTMFVHGLVFELSYLLWFVVVCVGMLSIPPRCESMCKIPRIQPSTDTEHSCYSALVESIPNLNFCRLMSTNLYP